MTATKVIPEVPMIGCVGGCGKQTPEETIENNGWTRLPITGRYRCGECSLVLERMSTIEGAPPRTDVDKLPPQSIGALKELPERPPLREGVKS